MKLTFNTSPLGRLLMTLCLWVLGISALSAQSRDIRGTVTSSEGEPLIGVTIVVEGAETRGTITELDGSYTIKAATGEKLYFSYTGYEAQAITISSESVINLVMTSSAVLLDDVVVIGYGSVRKSDLTGAVSSVSGDELKNSAMTNFDQALQGRVAGVQVTQNSGQPGGAASIRVRGASSINSTNEPLYVIDGIPFQGDGYTVAGFDWAGGANGQNRVNPLSTISPSDIVSIEVLKDASATAIYGSRAANGVILITTKRGRKGETKITYNGYYGQQTLARKLEMMNLQQFADYQLQVTRDLNLTPDLRYLDPTLLGPGTDWQEEIFRDAGMQSHQLSFSGGNDRTTYAISGGYFQQDGIIIGSNFDRYTTRISLDNQVKDWLKVGGSLAYSGTKEKITLNDGGDGIILQALVTQPDIAVKDLEGNYAGPEVTYGATNYNPVAAALQRNNTLERERILASVYGDVSLLKGMVFRSEIGFDDNHSLNRAFQPTYRWGALENRENQLRQREESSFFWIWKNYLTYNFKFGSAHSLTAMLGTEAQKSSWEGSQVTKKNFASNDIPVLSEGEDVTSRTTGWKDAATQASYFGRFNYNYNDRYLLTLTMRADGSSRFGPNNRWGYFPSGSFAWRLGSEEFMKSLNTDLKLRVGYGEVGNQSVGTYLFGSSLQTFNTPFGTAYRLEKIANPNLKWETSTQYNLGMDVSLIKNRVNLTVDFYKKSTRDMLLQLSVPSYLGGPNYNDIRAPFANAGSMENRGFEFSLNTYNFTGKQFSWNTNINFSLNRNEIKSLDSELSVYWTNLYWYSEFQTAARTSVGFPLGVFYGYQVEGIFTDQEDILNHAVQIQAPNSVSDDRPNGVNLVDKRTGVWIGDIKFKDVNGDGVVDTRDQTVIGNPNPDFTFGINNSFTMGPFDLVVFVNGSYGADILNYARVQTEGQTSLFSNQALSVNDRARYAYIDANGSDLDPANVYLANPGTDIPRPATNDNNRNNRMSDRFIEDGSYIRIQNLLLGYTLPARLTQKFRVQKFRVYGNVQNVHTFTKYSGYDPEIGSFNQNPLQQNVDMGRYPTPRVFILGLDVDF